MVFGNLFKSAKGNNVPRSRKLSIENLEDRALLAVVSGWEGNAAEIADADIQAVAAVPQPTGAVTINSKQDWTNAFGTNRDIDISGTIILNCDLDLSDNTSHTIKSSLVIEGNGHTITGFNQSDGAGIFSAWTQDVTFNNVNFIGNKAGYGGVIAAFSWSNVRFYNCSILNNSTGNGGVVYGTANIDMESCLVAYNYSTASGGAFQLSDGNTAGKSVTINIRYSTFAYNKTGGVGGAIYVNKAGVTPCSVSLFGCLFYGDTNSSNSADHVYLQGFTGTADRTAYTYSGNTSNIGMTGVTRTNCTYMDPEVTFVSHPSTYADYQNNTSTAFRLKETSGRRDCTMSTTSTKSTDLAGNARLYGTYIDAGCYEYFVPALPALPGTVTVQGYTGTGPGQVTVTTSGVPAGAVVTYSTSLNGTYTTTNPTYSAVGSYTTYVKVSASGYSDWQGWGTVQILPSGNVITVHSGDNLKTKITGAADNSTIIFDSSCVGATFTVNGLTGNNNALAKNLTIDASMVAGGVTINGGGADVFEVKSGKLILKNLKLTGGNQFIHLAGGETELYNCLVTGNDASGSTDNNTLAWAGVIANDFGSNAKISLYNCTITGNGSGNTTVGAVSLNGGTFTCKSTIICGNNGRYDSDRTYQLDDFCTNGGTLIFENSIIGTSNVVPNNHVPTEPGITYSTYGGLYLDSNYKPTGNSSLVVNKGAAVSGLPATDLAGNPRVNGSSVDIGCYEYYANAPCTGTFESASFTYNGSAQSIAVTNYTSGATVKYYYNGQEYNSVAAMNLTDVGVYTIQASVSKSGSTDWTGSATLTITKKAITVSGMSVTTKTYDGNTTATLSGGSLSGVVSGDSVSFTAAGTYDNKNVGTGKAVSVHYTLSGNGSGNYTIADAQLTGAITAKALTVSGMSVTTKTYDGNTTATLSGGSLSGVVSGDSVSFTAAGTYDNKNVGTGKAVSVHYTLSGAGSGNYTIADAQLTGAITAKALTVSGISVTTKEYDGNTTATLSGGSLSGVVSGDSVSFTAAGTYDNKNVGTGKAVSVYYTLSGTDSGNYSIADAQLTGAITAKQLTVSGTAVAATKAYDGTTAAQVTSLGTLNGVAAGDSITLTGATATYADANADTGKAVTVVYTLSGDLSNYVAPANAVLSADITKLTVTIAGPLSQDYDPTTTVASFTDVALSGVLAGETVTADITGSYADTSYAASKTLTITNCTLNGATAQNYELGSSTVTVDLTAVVTNLGGDESAGSLRAVIEAVEQGGGSEVVIDKENISGYDTVANVGRIVLADGISLSNINLVVTDGTNIILDGSQITNEAILTITGGTDAAPITVNNVTFTRKDASGTTHNSSASAVSVAAGAVTVMTDCSFSYNTSSASGAAVSVATAGKFTLNVSVSGVAVMQNNETTGFGGAIFSQGTVNLNGVLVLNNTAAKQGGAIANRDGILNLVNAVFTGNNVTGATYNGGAVMSTGTVTVSGGSFTNNNAGGNGGAVAALGGSVTMTGTALSGNTVAGYSSSNAPKYNDQSSSASNRSGGAIRVANAGTIVTLNDCSISGGYAYNGGAVSVATGATVNINGGSFSNNTAVFGGAIANGGTVVIGNSVNSDYAEFCGNKAGGYVAGANDTYTAGHGGAINNMMSADLTVTDAVFTGNTALNDNETPDRTKGGNGGAVANWGIARFTDSSFSGNSAVNGGAIANGQANGANAAGTLILTNVTLAENSANYGGALINTAAATLNGVTATANSAAKNGGAISNTTSDLSNGSLTFVGTQSVFGYAGLQLPSAVMGNENTCGGYGGAILSTAGTTVTFSTDVYAYENVAEKAGGDFMQNGATVVGANKLHAGSVVNPTAAAAALPNVPAPTAGSYVETKTVLVPTTACLCDVDGDLFVGPGDYSIINAAWLSEEGDENWDPRADIDGDGMVTGRDRALIASHWFDNLTEDELYTQETFETYFDIDDIIEGGKNEG